MIRVFQLAKDLRIGNRECLARLRLLGIEVNNHMSTLTDDQVQQVRDSLTTLVVTVANEPPFRSGAIIRSNPPRPSRYDPPMLKNTDFGTSENLRKAIRDAEEQLCAKLRDYATRLLTVVGEERYKQGCSNHIIVLLGNVSTRNAMDLGFAVNVLSESPDDYNAQTGEWLNTDKQALHKEGHSLRDDFIKLAAARAATV